MDKSKQIKKLKKEIRKRKIVQLIMNLLTLSVYSLLLYTYLIIYPFPESHVKVVYENMTEKQIKNVQEVLSDTKDIYLRVQREITFTTHIASYNCSCLGLNKNRKIVMQYTNDEKKFREIFCHEMIHSVLYKEGEDWAYDLSSYSPCYISESPKNLRKNPDYESYPYSLYHEVSP